MARMPRHTSQQPNDGPTIGEPLRHALAYAGLGWQVFPVHWVVDGRCSCGNVCDSPGKHPIRELTPHGLKDATTEAATLQRWWAQHPQANVAIRTGAASGVWVLDVDVGGGKQGDIALESLTDQHGALPDTVQGFTGSGGLHYVFRYPVDGRAVRNRTNAPGQGLDVRGDEGYIVAPPSVHISGGVYEWEAAADPLEGQASADPPEWLLAAVAAPVGQKAASAPLGGIAAPAPLMREQVLEVKSALGYLDYDDRETWLDVGFALHASGAGQQAYGIWCDWARQSERKYSDEGQAKTWRSFKEEGNEKGKINLESIFAWARDRGWVNPASNEYQQWWDKQRELIEQANRRTEYRTVNHQTVAEKKLPVPVLEQAAEWMRRQMPTSQSHVCTHAALALASAMAARRYVSSDGDPAHTYLGVISQSIGEVRDVKNLVQQLIVDAGQRHLIKGMKMSTAHLVYKALLREPALFWVADDYGQMVQFARRQPSGLVSDALSVIAECYKSRHLFIDKDADPVALKHYDDCTIYNPALTMFAFISDDQVGAISKRSEIGRGAVTQMLCVQAGAPEPNTDLHPQLPAPNAVIETARRMRAGKGEGNLADILPGTLPADPTVVTFPAEVQMALSGYDRQFLELVREQPYLVPLAMGARQTMRRILVALAAWQAPERPYAQVPLAEWAGQYVLDHLSAFVDRVQVIGSESDKPDAYEKVLEAVHEAGPQGISRRKLVQGCWAFRSLNTAKREELIETMLGDELLVEQKTPSGRGKVLVDHRFLERVQ